MREQFVIRASSRSHGWNCRTRLTATTRKLERLCDSKHRSKKEIQRTRERERERNVHSQSMDKGSSVPLEYLPSQRISPTFQPFSSIRRENLTPFDRDPYRKRNNRVAYSHGFHCNPDTAPVRAKWAQLSVPLSSDTDPLHGFGLLVSTDGKEIHTRSRNETIPVERERVLPSSLREESGSTRVSKRGPPARNRGHSMVTRWNAIRFRYANVKATTPRRFRWGTKKDSGRNVVRVGTTKSWLCANVVSFFLFFFSFSPFFFPLPLFLPSPPPPHFSAAFVKPVAEL